MQCPDFKQRSWIDFDKGYHCQNSQYINAKRKYQTDKRVRRKDGNFSTRPPYANKKMREIYFSTMNTKYKKGEELMNKGPKKNGRAKYKFHHDFFLQRRDLPQTKLKNFF